MEITRIPLPDLDQLTEAQGKSASEIAAGPRGTRMAAQPRTRQPCANTGRIPAPGYGSRPANSELVILVVARHYSCHYIWFNHVGLASKNGLPADAIDCIKNRQEPVFNKSDEAVAYAFSKEILLLNAVSDATLAQARTLFGNRGVIEMGAIIGHYHSGAVALGLVDIELPDGSNLPVAISVGSGPEKTF